MDETINHSWYLAARPYGMPKLTDFELRQSPIPSPGPGQVLIASRYHSLDPYMRLRLNSADSVVGTLMVGDAVGEVIESRAAGFVAGDIAMGNIGWQEYGVLDAGLLRKIDPSVAPISTSLGILGMPGLTAYFGLFEIGRPIPGDTVVVSAASGAVGAVVGQLAKLSGCRVIGIAGTDEKINYVVDELGFDAGVNYKSEDIPTRLGTFCPDGIDIYWDNVGGELADAAIEKIASGGRAVICGQIAQYNATSPHVAEPTGTHGRVLGRPIRRPQFSCAEPPLPSGPRRCSQVQGGRGSGDRKLAGCIYRVAQWGQLRQASRTVEINSQSTAQRVSGRLTAPLRRAASSSAKPAPRGQFPQSRNRS